MEFLSLKLLFPPLRNLNEISFSPLHAHNPYGSRQNQRHTSCYVKWHNKYIPSAYLFSINRLFIPTLCSLKVGRCLCRIKKKPARSDGRATEGRRKGDGRVTEGRGDRVGDIADFMARLRSRTIRDRVHRVHRGLVGLTGARMHEGRSKRSQLKKKTEFI